jgi:hypothetical protein
MFGRYTFAAPRVAHTGSHLLDANVRHISSHGASVFAAPFQCVWFLQLAAAGFSLNSFSKAFAVARQLLQDRRLAAASRIAYTTLPLNRALMQQQIL